MAYDLKSEEDVKQYLHNLGIEYRFGCYSEKKPEVCHLLGDYLEAVKKDFGKAAKVFRTNCDDYAYGKSCYKYSVYCMLGKGGVEKNFGESYRYLDTACRKDEPAACLNQGLMLVSDNSEKGVAMDVPKGVELMEKSCKAQNANACYYLSSLYIGGVRRKTKEVTPTPKTAGADDKYLLKPSMSLAHRYALEACHLGNVYSCANLSQMYARGEGVEKNEELAKKYKTIVLELQKELETGKSLTFQQGIQ